MPMGMYIPNTVHFAIFPTTQPLLQSSMPMFKVMDVHIHAHEYVNSKCCTLYHIPHCSIAIATVEHVSVFPTAQQQLLLFGMFAPKGMYL